ncbi:SDR family oxidoreductase [Thermomonospora umbrina]|uniref:Short-subunit dehydrogenase n=1 Tax=Thermomonospora umbrina TaxID=111806 RepID=A0A3D9SXJ7_9ACTN|nr:SDR family oxidoreductase [Thermomonospora umbrina]REF00683.1 short-subunit dehydrogenase [Thermomonospora umbrina]
MTGTVLVTGAGTGFGKEIALRLAGRGVPVIAGVEIVAQVAALRAEAERAGVGGLRVEKLDVTDPADRRRAWGWKVDVLLNNAGISEGGAVVDIPLDRVRRQFEVNVFGPIALTQGFARAMVRRGGGRIVFMSSVAGLTVDPFTGAYSGSKHALEAFADALHTELREFGVQVATVNPGPFLTGFNDRMFECWTSWTDDPAERVFDYAELAFPHEQFDPEPVIEVTVGVVTGEIDRYRNVVPADMQDTTRRQMEQVWDRPLTGDRSRPALVQRAYDLQPGTPAT